MSTVKKQETDEQREYWDFIERKAQQSRERRPAWASKIEGDEEEPTTTVENRETQATLRCD